MQNTRPPKSFLSYEQAKREWVAAHPEATSAEYEQAMRAIAARLGV